MNKLYKDNTGKVFLENHRKEIDYLDDELMRVLAKRFKVIPILAEYKKSQNLSVYQKNREDEIIAARRAMAEELNLNPDMVEGIFKLIFEDSGRMQDEIFAREDAPEEE